MASHSRDSRHNVRPQSEDNQWHWNDPPTRVKIPASSSVSSSRNPGESKSKHEDMSTSKTSGWGFAESLSGWGEPQQSTSTWGVVSSTSSVKGKDPRSPTTRARWPSPPARTSSAEQHNHHPPPLPAGAPSIQPPPPHESKKIPKPSLHVYTNAGSPTTARASGKARTTPTTSKPRDLRKAYSNRVAQLSEAVALRNEYTQVLRTLEARRKMLNTQKYCHISEASQAKLDGHAQEYEERARELKSRLDETLLKLVEAEAWPEGAPASEPPATHESALKQLQDFQKRLESLETSVNNADFRHGRKSSSQNEDTNKLPVDSKRHLSLSSGQADSNADILNRLEYLESRFEDISNEFTQQTENLLQMVEPRIEERLHALHIRVPEDVEMPDVDGVAKSLVPTNMNFSEQIKGLRNDFEGYANETVDLIRKHQALALEVKKSLEENKALKTRTDKLESSNGILQDDMNRMKNEMQAVLAAIKIIRTTPSSVDISALKQQIREDILDELRPALLDLRSQCEAALTLGGEETLQRIVAKLGVQSR